VSLRQQKMLRKKQEILRAAAEVLDEKGFHGATMEEIASRLLMTQGSMYYYFKNKEDLLFQCYIMIMDISLKKIKEIMEKAITPTEKLKKAIESHIELAITERPIFSLMGHPDQIFSGEYLDKIIQLRSDYDRYFDKILDEGIQAKEFLEVDVKMTRLIILGALNWVQQWYSPKGDKSKEEITDIFSNYLLKIVLNHSPQKAM